MQVSFAFELIETNKIYEQMLTFFILLIKIKKINTFFPHLPKGVIRRHGATFTTMNVLFDDFETTQ
jgi:hypothetical protein